MDEGITRRVFHATLVGAALTGAAIGAQADEPERDYPAPTFKPALKKPRLGGTFIQDFVIFGHYDLPRWHGRPRRRRRRSGTPRRNHLTKEISPHKAKSVA